MIGITQKIAGYLNQKNAIKDARNTQSITEKKEGKKKRGKKKRGKRGRGKGDTQKKGMKKEEKKKEENIWMKEHKEND